MNERLDISLRRAQAYFFSQLCRIVGNIDGLTAGDEFFDYIVQIESSRLHAVSQELSALWLDVYLQFDVEISVMAVSLQEQER